MPQIATLWTALDPRRRLIAAAAVVAALLAVVGLFRMAAQTDMALLYAGLEPAVAGEVLAALDQQTVRYDIRGGSIFVDGAQRDALRLTLAGQGLPANSVQGYELLDSLSGFGTTAQMFDAAYWRAKEGELARTITAASDIRSARVHIANPSSSPFQRGLAPTASVTVTAGGALDQKRATALRYLVASAVAGLDPAGVSVIDGRTGFVVAGDDAPGSDGAADDRALTFKRNIERLLEARVGPGKAVVEVSVETVSAREAITERLIDPESRVAISEAVEERAASSNETGGGAVTVASNLPEGDAAGDDGQARSNDTETRETVNYDVSETRREILREPGAIKKISVAVLVDGIRSEDPVSGVIGWQARPEEEITALRDLVASAVGFDAARGDEITLKSMEFLPVDAPDSTAPSGWVRFGPLDTMRLVQLAVLATVAMALGLFVVRPVLTAQRVPNRVEPAALGGPDVPRVAPAGLPGPVAAAGTAQATVAAGGVRTGEVEAARIESGGGEAPGVEGGEALPVLHDQREPAMPGTDLAEVDPSTLDPVTRLRRLIEDRQDETLEILRGWMEDREEQA